MNSRVVLTPSQVIRGTIPIRMECCPAFDYARAQHHTSIIPDDSIPDLASPTSQTYQNEQGVHKKALFHSKDLILDLRYVAEGCPADGDIASVHAPVVELKKLDLSAKGHLGEGVACDLELRSGQAVTFVLRVPPETAPPKSSRPTRDQANQLGVSIQSKLKSEFLASFWFSAYHLYSVVRFDPRRIKAEVPE